jgi:4-amino-4-deoxy-L-arabinose transferase-like glycosyltransferase
VGAVMVRDWLASGRWLTPLTFARDYYTHYPFFAVGYWPPLFSVVTGVWLLVAGVGRLQAVIIPALFAAGTGWLVFRFVRLRVGFLAGVCAVTLYLSLPAVRQWMCAVMVDHMTAFLCIAVAACLVRYLKRPVVWNGFFCGVACGCAILSKYNAVYTAVLPFLAVVVLRRVELLRKPSFLVQPVIVALMVVPWAFWTKGLAFYGVPSEREALTAKRAALFVLATLKLFPPALMVVVILGLLVLVRPRAWRADLVVLSPLAAGHLACLILSPVTAEQRYLLVPAAVLLVASFTGWSEVLSSISLGGNWVTASSVFATILAVSFAVSQFGYFPRKPPQEHISSAIALVVKDSARAAQTVVVPPLFEGPAIAEFVAQSRHRPDHYLLRPGKVLAHSDWFGGSYSLAFATPEEMMEYFRQHPVNLLMWTESREATLQAHARIMSEMLRRYPLSWHRVPSLHLEGGFTSSWTMYEYKMPPQQTR